MKKALSLILASALAVSMAVPAFAAVATRRDLGGVITSIDEHYTTKGDVESISKDNYQNIEVRPGAEIRFWLAADMFANYATKYAGTDLAVTSADVKETKISLRTSIKAGSKYIEDINLQYKSADVHSIGTSGQKTAVIVIKFIDPFVSTKAGAFSAIGYLLVDGKRYDEYGFDINGELKNFEIDVFSDDEYVNLEGGYVAIAEEHVGNIEADLGYGVSIFTKFFKDKKYYGIADKVADDAADIIFAKYPDVDAVYRLQTVGLNSTGDIVKIDAEGNTYYVYNNNMEYLGTTDDMLPFSNRYYLANTKLDIVSDVVEEETPVEIVPEVPNTGGDDGIPNVNDNPGTGR